MTTIEKTQPLHMTGAELFWYYLACVVTLGTPYFVKVFRKKALIEVYNQA